MDRRRILVTSALPYANGHIHIGHLVEYLQTDIWVRFQKLRGHDCRYFCADDTHGTAIMIRARNEGRSEQELIRAMSQAHQQDFAGFGIAFDHYGSTDSDANRAVCEDLWRGVRAADLVEERTVQRFFDPTAGIFLADRFIKGGCPRCQAIDQYGDSCDRCGATYAATEVIEPRSTISGATPELRDSQQLFIVIEKLHEFLEEWTQSGRHLQNETANYLKGHFLSEPLRDWDVSRPAPYFGFEIPDAPGNYWYVWFDAPIGYIASCKEWCAANGEDFGRWWGPATEANAGVEIHHFIGRDIVYFHTLFWPATLQAAGYRLPDRVHVHGFLTVDGEKMSKTKGTFIQAATYLEHLDPAYLRYFYASKLNGRDENIDLNLEEFANKVNADLVGKVVNLASRTAKFVAGQELCADYPDDDGLFAAGAAEGAAIAAAYEHGNFAEAMRRIMALADAANEFVERAQPWTLKKDPARADELRRVCSIALNLFRQLVVYLTPVLPRLSEQTEELLGVAIDHWDDAARPLTGTPVAAFKHLLQRVDSKRVAAMVAASTDATAETAAAAETADDDTALRDEPVAATCDFDDFMRVDLRVVRIVAAEEVPKSNKLLQVTCSLGGDERRTVFAGIKKAYRPSELIGRLAVLVANLVPRKMRFGTSEGMLVAAGPGGEELFLLAPDSGAVPGQRIH